MSVRNILFFISLYSLCTQAHAGVFAQTGLHFGGDTLAKVSFFGADSQSVEAGGLISGSLGYEADIGESMLVKLSAGIKFDAVATANGDVDFTRYPLSGMVFMKGENIHFGVGITQHTGVKFTIDGFSGSDSVDFDDATGLVIQIDYLLNERGYLSLKYTSIDYQPVNSNFEVDGSSLGLLIGFRFGN